MKFAAFLLLVFFGGLKIFAQDGSDMKYVKPSDLNDSHLGRTLHIDFFRRSFSFFGSPRDLDSIEIDLDGRKSRFVEHRVDDGFNNWFKDQYLEAVEIIDRSRLRIVRFELLKLAGDSIFVRAYFRCFDKKGVESPAKAFSRELTFKKADIAELLFEASN